MFDRPDPRRIDLRASLADLQGEWLVRVHRQLASVAVRLVVDVSESMRFGAPRKIDVVADLARALGRSAFRVGDALGLVGFDADARDDLFVPPWRARAAGEVMADALLASVGGRGDGSGLRAVAERIGGRPGLVFLASDFLWPLAGLDDALALLRPAHVVPLVFNDSAELAPPMDDGLALVTDAETGARRSLWIRPRLRERWRADAAQRRIDLQRLFAAQGLRPFWIEGALDAQALEQHLLEVDA
ncbi:MAG TPA: MxaS protein [Burkholderiaceae bacterium]|nr:MxaS protein [Burkholderiaceae bacterium]